MHVQVAEDKTFGLKVGLRATRDHFSSKKKKKNGRCLSPHPCSPLRMQNKNKSSKVQK
jgi:hypothetical protein